VSGKATADTKKRSTDSSYG